MSYTTAKAQALADLENGDTFAAFENLRNAALLAEGASAWAEALNAYEMLYGLIASLGSTEKQGGKTRTRIEWAGGLEALESKIDFLRRRQLSTAAMVGMSTQKLKYVRPEGSSDA